MVSAKFEKKYVLLFFFSENSQQNRSSGYYFSIRYKDGFLIYLNVAKSFNKLDVKLVVINQTFSE